MLSSLHEVLKDFERDFNDHNRQGIFQVLIVHLPFINLTMETFYGCFSWVITMILRNIFAYKNLQNKNNLEAKDEKKKNCKR